MPPSTTLNLAVEHAPGVLAALSGRPPLECGGVVLRLGRPDEVLAVRLDGNPLDERGDTDPWIFDPTLPGDCLVSWSGSLGQSLFAADPRTWMAAGQARFRAFCDQVRPALEREGRTLLLQPHHRHVLSDVPGTRAFLAERHDQPFGLALAPASMLDRSMLVNAEEHLERIIAALGPVASLVILEDLRPSFGADTCSPLTGSRAGNGVAKGDAGECDVVTVALGQGVLPGAVMRRLLRDHVPPSTPLVLRPAGLEAQRAWLADDHRDATEHNGATGRPRS